MITNSLEDSGLSELGNHLEQAAAIEPMVLEFVEGHDAPAITVVIPTHNRCDLLAQTLVAVFGQELPPKDYEVIVVDNDSQDGTQEMLQETAAHSRCGFRAARLPADYGPAVARNVGVLLARGRLIAFTDSDCLPTPAWLGECLEGMTEGIGIVQGRTTANPKFMRRLFSHTIETHRLDGSFSTSNVCYRRRAIVAVGGFDPGCDYWEDTDLGWRVLRSGWLATFASRALVHHQILPLSPVDWLKWPLHFRSMPAKAERYPEFRSHLFFGIWVHWFHALFDLALISMPLSILIHPVFLLLTLPYLLAFPRQHGLRGRLPPVKAAFHIAWDGLSFLTLLVSSLRHRSLVL